MDQPLHTFHIPVMGTGFSIDTAIRVGVFGIASVIPLQDHVLAESVRKHYCQENDIVYEAIPRSDPEACAKRFESYLNLVHDLVEDRVREIKAEDFVAGSDKTRYFRLLPESSPLKRAYLRFLELPEGAERDRLGEELTAGIQHGRIDVNMLTKVDPAAFDADGNPLPPELRISRQVLRGYARSKLRGNIVFSAGINPSLYGTLTGFPDFYRDASGTPKKGIVLKVSNLRSALVQGKFLARKGLEVAEFRLESGLNCGGHAFASDGSLLGPVIEDFLASAELFSDTFEEPVARYYQRNGMELPDAALGRRIPLTAQGGLGTHGELRRLIDSYGLESTGWASPFLLVPEATALDLQTRERLAASGPEDLFLSDASPLGIKFNLLRNASAEEQRVDRIAGGRPGSPCPKGYLALDTEFPGLPRCRASRDFQELKLKELGYDSPPPASCPDPRVQELYAKACICHELGNGALMDLGISKKRLPVLVCPGPNLASFDRLYTLEEMVDHIYGRGPSLVPPDRPHFFAKELTLNVDFWQQMVGRLDPDDAEAVQTARAYADGLLRGVDCYRRLVKVEPYEGENLESLRLALDTQEPRIRRLLRRLEARPEATRTA